MKFHLTGPDAAMLQSPYKVRGNKRITVGLNVRPGLWSSKCHERICSRLKMQLNRAVKA